MTALRRSSPAILISSTDLTHTALNARAGGVVAYKQVTEHSGTFYRNEATITGFDTGPIVTYDNRIYRVSFQLAIQMSDVSPGSDYNNVRIWLTDGDNTHLCYVDYPPIGTHVINQCIGRTYLHVDPGAGTRRYKLRGEVTFTSTTAQPFASCDVSLPGWIMVEDVGPSTGYS